MTTGNITSAGTAGGGDITFTGPVVLKSGATNITTGTTGTGNITFTSAVDGSGDLTLTAGGDISFQGNVGDPIPLNSLNITGANNTSFLREC